MSNCIAEPVEAVDTLKAWVLKDDDKIVGAAWTDEDEGEVFFHVRVTDGKALGKAKVLKEIIPFDSWILIPYKLIKAARYLQRYVGLVTYEPIYHKGELYLPLRRERD